MIFQTLAAAAFFVTVFSIPGWLAVRSLLVAPIAGLCTFGPAVILTSAIFGFHPITVVLTWVALVTLLGRVKLTGLPQVAFELPGPDGEPASDGSDGPFPGPSWRAALGVAFVAAIPTLQLFPVWTGGGLWLDGAYVEQAKVSLVDAFARHGLPAQNPYLGGTDLSYYFASHFQAALPRMLLGLHAWPCLIAFTWFAGVSLIGVLATWAHELARASGLLILLTALGPPTLALRKIGLIRPAVTTPELEGIGPLIMQIETVPQHVAAAAALIFAMRLAVRRPRGTVWLLGGAFAFAAGSSAWLALVFFLCVPAILARRRELGRLGFAAGGIAVLICFPLVTAMMSGKGGAAAPVEFSVFHASRLTDRSWAHLILYWIQFTPLWMGLAFLAGWRGLFHAKRSAFRDISVPCILIPLCVTLLFRSTLVHNDLGWCAVLLPCALLNVWAAVALRRRLMPRIIAYGGIGLGLWSSARCWDRPDPKPAEIRQEQTLRRRFAIQPAAWAVVRRYAGPNDLVQNNPDAFSGITSGVTDEPGNISWAMFANRSAAAGDSTNLFVYAWRQGERPRDTLRAVRSVFRHEKPAPAAVRRLAEELNIRVLLVGRDDEVWPGAAIIASGAYRLAHGAKDYRVFVREK